MRILLLCVALVLAASAPAAAQSVMDDVQDTLNDPTNPQYGSLKESCYRTGECGGCGPWWLEWIVGAIYCV